MQHAAINIAYTNLSVSITMSHILITTNACMQKQVIIVIQLHRIRVSGACGIADIGQAAICLDFVLQDKAVVVRGIASFRINTNYDIQLSVLHYHALTMYPAW